MKFCDFIVMDATIEDIQQGSKEDILKEMLQSLQKCGVLDQKGVKGALTALLKRESLGSTAIGRGIAVPHTKHSHSNRPIGLVGRSRDGVDFAAIDGEPVFVFFLVLSPENEPALHLKALEYILLRMRHDNFVRFLKNARDTQEIIELLKEADEYELPNE